MAKKEQKEIDFVNSSMHVVSANNGGYCIACFTNGNLNYVNAKSETSDSADFTSDCFTSEKQGQAFITKVQTVK